MDDHDAFGSSGPLREGLRRTIPTAAATTGCSQQVLDDLRDHFGLAAGCVVPNGVGPVPSGPPSGTLPDELELELELRSAPLVFGVGRLEMTKGFDLLVEAFAAVDPALGATLVIGGDGSQRQALQALGDRLGLARRFHPVGPLVAVGVHTWMRRADVAVMPSRREAFGIVPLGAWRAAPPLV